MYITAEVHVEKITFFSISYVQLIVSGIQVCGTSSALRKVIHAIFWFSCLGICSLKVLTLCKCNFSLGEIFLVCIGRSGG